MPNASREHLLAEMSTCSTGRAAIDVMVQTLWARLAVLRGQNDSRRLSETETAILRGRIAETKALLVSLGETDQRPQPVRGGLFNE